MNMTQGKKKLLEFSLMSYDIVMTEKYAVGGNIAK